MHSMFGRRRGGRCCRVQPGIHMATIISGRCGSRSATGYPPPERRGMRRFLEAHGFGRLEPAQELLAVNTEEARHQRAARSRDGRFVIVYSPLGETVRLTRQLLAPGVRASWFDPRTGAPQVATFGPAGFDPPGAPARGNDWALLIERANR